MLDLTQLIKTPHVDNSLPFGLSPDGAKAAFARNKTGKWEIYLLDLTKPNFPAEQISRGEGAKFAPKFSPDGTKLIYPSDYDGSESYHIILHDLQDDKIINLTPDDGYAHQPNLAWSPGGKEIALLTDSQGQFALYLLSITGGEPRLLFDIGRPCWNLNWSPDSKWIAVEVEGEASYRWVYLVEAATGQWRQIMFNDKPLRGEHSTWSPDSRYLTFSGESGEWHDIGVYDVETNRIEWITQSEGNDTSPCWRRDGKGLAWIHAEGARAWLEVRERGGETKRYTAGEGVHSFPRFISNDEVILIYESPSQPPDLWKVNLIDNSFTQLTNSLPAEIDRNEFIEPQEVWYSARDGTQVPALLYRPENAGKDSPAVILIHGGPNWHLQYLWFPLISHMASRGWTVLAPNYRGSTGYGRQWQNASRYDMGGVDLEDCVAGVDYLLRAGLAHPKKIAVTGSSHGGYLTMMCLTMYPRLWAAGSAVVPFLNWIASHYNSREDLQHWNIENMGDPDENHKLWHDRSPFFFLDRIQSPVQLISGENDPRCPASDSIEARDKLIELGREVEFLLYKGEGHSFLKIENVIDSELRRVEFLAKALERKPQNT